ncbi:hypothetical protein LPYR103PRE_13030 [Segatella asaccharophila]|jgi:hypothetical protein
MKQRTLILILCCGMTTCFQPLFANKELTDPMYNENEDYIPTHQGPVRRLAYHASPITLINDGTEATITFYQGYTNCKILVYKDGMFFSSSTYATIPAGYMETLTFNGPGSYEIDILSEEKTVYSTELDIK